MRIASINKPLTMAVLAKLWEEGKVDLDSPVTKYVSDWPAKLVDGKDKFENGIQDKSEIDN